MGTRTAGAIRLVKRSVPAAPPDLRISVLDSRELRLREIFAQSERSHARRSTLVNRLHKEFYPGGLSALPGDEFSRELDSELPLRGPKTEEYSISHRIESFPYQDFSVFVAEVRGVCEKLRSVRGVQYTAKGEEFAVRIPLGDGKSTLNLSFQKEDAGLSACVIAGVQRSEEDTAYLTWIRIAQCSDQKYGVSELFFDNRNFGGVLAQRRLAQLLYWMLLRNRKLLGHFTQALARNS
jgi:hypothetical protein